MVTVAEENKKVFVNEIDYRTCAKIKRFSNGAILDPGYE